MKQELDDKNKEMMEKMRVKDEMLAELRDEMILKQNCFDAAINKRQISNLQHQLLQQSDLLSSVMRNHADKEETFQYVLTEKHRNLATSIGVLPFCNHNSNNNMVICLLAIIL